MTKRVFLILSLIMTLCLGISAVAFADVPDIGGKRPIPPSINTFRMYRECDAHRGGRMRIDFYFTNPAGSTVEYFMNDIDGNTLEQGVVECDSNKGQFALEFALPEPGKSCDYVVLANCYKDRVKTFFGYKKLDKREEVGSFGRAYTIKCDEDGHGRVVRN